MSGRNRRWFCLALALFFLQGFPADASEAETARQQYADYKERFEGIHRMEDVEASGYRIFEEQVFSVVFESFGEEELTFLPALEETWNRLAFFLADQDGNILYRYDELETNNCIRGAMRQPTRELASVSFADADKDGRTDIVFLTRCVNETGDYAGIPYKVGDVLFQGNGGFYRDWRVSDKINRFSMNKSAGCILSFVRDEEPVECLYTAKNLEELTGHGFLVAEEQSYTREFEKLGRLRVVPGTLRVSEYNIFMVYLVDEQGDIVWSLQPMDDFDSLYALKGIHGRDLDGDGLKDLVILGRYISEGPSGDSQVESGCAIYYQRTAGFERDTEFGTYYQCTEEDTMETLVEKIREYWGYVQ